MSFRPAWTPRAIPIQLGPSHLFLGAFVVWVVAVVVAQSAARLSIVQAIALLFVPLLALVALARPSWIVLLIAASPIGLIEPGRTIKPLILILMLTLVGQTARRGTLSLGAASGFLPFAILIIAGLVFQVDLTGDTASFASGFLNGLIALLLLGWLAYNVTRTGDLDGRRLADALLLGLAVTIVLDMTLALEIPGLSGPGASVLGRKSGYLAAMGFLICFARLIVPTEGRPYDRATHLALMLLFGIGMSTGLLRGAWLSAVIGVILIAVWAGKKRYWILIPAALVLLLAFPVARERVVPTENISITGDASLTSYTTGRWDLWTRLWAEIESGLPLGHGFGYTFTLTPEDLFGPGSSDFLEEGAVNTFVYPHNDFLFLMIEFGFLGLFGIGLLWAQVVRAFRAVSRSGTELAGYAHIAGGILITIFVAQMVANVLTSLALASRFFIVAGFVFGARGWLRRYPGTDPAVAAHTSHDLR